MNPASYLNNIITKIIKINYKKFMEKDINMLIISIFLKAFKEAEKHNSCNNIYNNSP